MSCVRSRERAWISDKLVTATGSGELVAWVSRSNDEEIGMMFVAVGWSAEGAEAELTWSKLLTRVDENEVPGKTFSV